MGKRHSSKPILKISKRFWGKTQEPWVKTEFGSQTWYQGSGVAPQAHPLWPHLEDFRHSLTCNVCDSKEILVVACQVNVHLMSGDLYLDCEYRCEQCGTFTLYSYSEN